eukprot:scaffold7599_cov248-Pinguiococcus_pyrenoidosus.AAC.2
MNPTASPTTSALLNGEWELLYSSGVGLPALLVRSGGQLPSQGEEKTRVSNEARAMLFPTGKSGGVPPELCAGLRRPGQHRPHDQA